MLKDLNLIGMYVTDVSATSEFYKTIGFEVVSQDDTLGLVELNGFKLQFVAKSTAEDMDESFKEDAFGEPKGTGIYINIEVEDIDKFYDDIINAGINPSTMPRDWPWGNREFVARDPDGYKLVFYQKIK